MQKDSVWKFEKDIGGQLSSVLLWLGPQIGSLRWERTEQRGLDGPVPRWLLYSPVTWAGLNWDCPSKGLYVASPLQ